MSFTSSIANNGGISASSLDSPLQVAVDRLAIFTSPTAETTGAGVQQAADTGAPATLVSGRAGASFECVRLRHQRHVENFIHRERLWIQSASRSTVGNLYVAISTIAGCSSTTLRSIAVARAAPATPPRTLVFGQSGSFTSRTCSPDRDHGQPVFSVRNSGGRSG